MLIREQRGPHLDVSLRAPALANTDITCARIKAQPIAVQHNNPWQILGDCLCQSVRYGRKIIEPQRARFRDFGRIEQNSEGRASLAAPQEKGQIVETLDLEAEAVQKVLALPHGDLLDFGRGCRPFLPAWRVDREGVESEQAFVAQARHRRVK